MSVLNRSSDVAVTKAVAVFITTLLLFVAASPSPALSVLESDTGPGEALSATSRSSASRPSSRPVIVRIDSPRLKDHLGEVVRVTARVYSATLTRNGKMLRILFRGGRESGFSAVVFESNLRAFRAEFGDDLSTALSNRLITITGELTEFRDSPQLILSDPEQLIILDTGESAGEESPDPTSRRSR